jgi:hypothetical protein
MIQDAATSLQLHASEKPHISLAFQALLSAQIGAFKQFMANGIVKSE